MSNRDNFVEASLRKRFQKLTSTLGIHNLKFKWIPKNTGSLSGEVRNNTLYVYESSEEKALKTLNHEIVDYILSTELVSPNVRVINLLVGALSNEIYQKKEKVIERICKLLEI